MKIAEIPLCGMIECMSGIDSGQRPYCGISRRFLGRVDKAGHFGYYILPSVVASVPRTGRRLVASSANLFMEQSMPCGRKMRKCKMNKHKRKKRLRLNRHKNKP
ncbi:MAG: hypothetical protein NTV22_17270 [bacterium]|nr:hypothetical protein [bacterium]